MTSNQDSGQGFAGIKRSAKLNTPRKNGPGGGGTTDAEEAVDLKPIDRSAKNWVGLGPRQGDTTTFEDSRKVGTGDKPFDWPRDDTKDSTAVLTDPVANGQWGREAPALARRVSWQSYASDPGRPSPLDPETDSNPKRPDWKAPSHDAYNISGPGEGEEVIGGQKGKIPIPGKPDQWA